MQRIIQRRCEPGEAGISLLEILMAISLLGISFASIFSGLSAALRTTDRLDRIEQGSDYAARKLSELVLDPSLAPGEIRSGVSPSGMAWQATTQLVDTRPLSDPDAPAQLVRINLEVSWRTRSGRQSLNLETLKLRVPEPPPAP
jgi:type II secretory pathway pseudopilin PulG